MMNKLTGVLSKRLIAPICSLSRNVYMNDPNKLSLQQASEPFCPIPGVNPKFSNAEEAFEGLKDGAKIFVQGASSTPSVLLQELHKYAKSKQLKGIELYHLFTLGPYPFIDPDCENIFSSRSLFVGENCREAVNAGVADFYPVLLSEVPLLFRRKVIHFDMALISVSPPGKHGYCSLGASVDITRSAIQNANTIVGQVNPNVPETFGDASIHSSHLNFLVYGAEPLHEMPMIEPSIEELHVSRIIAENLVEDGCTIEAGFGSIPQILYRQLSEHKNLGIHTEMFNDTLVDLISVGAITNAYKQKRPGKVVTSFVVGTRKAFDFIDNNPQVDMCDIEWAASPANIAVNPKPTCINTCLAIDLTGQVACDSIGNYIYSGVGGIVDFMRGAAISLDGKGKPIIGITSRTRTGIPKIVPMLQSGSGVVLTRAHIHYVVTEYGIAYLFGKNLRQRAYALIQVAHPDDREALEKAAYENLKTMPSPE